MLSQEEPDRQTAPRGKLLIIEDALIHSTIIARMADKVGFTTATAGSYEDACELLHTRHFDCITLDLALGRHVGAEVLNHLSRIGCAARIIIISGSEKAVCEETVRIGRSLGLDICDPVSKPIDLKALQELLQHISMQVRLERLATSPI